MVATKVLLSYNNGMIENFIFYVLQVNSNFLPCLDFWMSLAITIHLFKLKSQATTSVYFHEPMQGANKYKYSVQVLVIIKA